jgi:hypothetical protein
MPFKVTPAKRKDGKPHRVRFSHAEGGHALSEKGDVVNEISVHFARRFAAGEVEIVEGTVDDKGAFTPKPVEKPKDTPAPAAAKEK